MKASYKIVTDHGTYYGELEGESLVEITEQTLTGMKASGPWFVLIDHGQARIFPSEKIRVIEIEPLDDRPKLKMEEGDPGDKPIMTENIRPSRLGLWTPARNPKWQAEHPSG